MTARTRLILYFAAFLLGLSSVHWTHHKAQDMQTAVVMELVNYGLAEAGEGER